MKILLLGDDTIEETLQIPNLSEILCCLNQLELKWRILQAEGINEGDNFASEWRTLAHSASGMLIDSRSSQQFDMTNNTQLDTAFIVGYKNEFPGIFNNMHDWCKHYDSVISLCDSAIWSIFLKDSSYYQKLITQFSYCTPRFEDSL